MKNITDILSEIGITIPAEQTEAFNKAFGENYKTVADYEKQATKLAQATESLKTAQDGLKKFDGVDVESLNAQIAKLTQDLTDKDTAHAAELADLALDSTIEEEIRKAKGKNSKAIKALLDIDALKASKNQAADVKSAIENCQKENDFMFGDNETPPPFAGGAGSGGMGGDKGAFNFGFTGVRAHETN